MNNITLGQISSVILFLVALIGGVTALLKYIKTMLSFVIKEEIKPLNAELENKLENINSNIKELNSNVYELGVNDCKNFLTIELARLENGEVLSTDEKQWIHHNYQKYTNVYKQNSYIHDKFEKLRKEEKI